MHEPEFNQTSASVPHAAPQCEPQVVNEKKMALKCVLEAVEEAVEDVGADSARTGRKPPSESLTNGLGGDGSAWKSALADKIHTDLAGVLGTISSCFSSEEDKVRAEWNSEPQYVDKTDPRAKWRGI